MVEAAHHPGHRGRARPHLQGRHRRRGQVDAVRPVHAGQGIRRQGTARQRRSRPRRSGSGVRAAVTAEHRDLPAGGPPRQGGRPRIVTVVHQEVVTGQAPEYPRLGRPVIVQGAVPVKVVGGHVEQHRHPGRQGVAVLQLETRHLEHGDIPIVEGDVADRPTDVSGGHGADSRFPQHGRGLLHDGGLAVGPGHRHHRTSQPPDAQLHLAPHRDAGLRGRPEGDRTGAESGTGDHAVDAVQHGRAPLPASVATA